MFEYYGFGTSKFTYDYNKQLGINTCTVQPQLSKFQLSEHLIIQTVAMTVLLEYFVTCVCSIRVVHQSSVLLYRRSMGFICPNKFTDLTLL